MADTGRSPHLARNAALAALVILGSTAAVTAGAVRPGARTESCPGGEDWVVTQPVDATMTGYGPGTRPGAPAAPGSPNSPGSPASPGKRATAGAPAHPGALGGSRRTPTRSAAPPVGGSAQVVATPLTLAGCVNTERLHPLPAGNDGRG
jgi:hypothetical protein